MPRHAPLMKIYKCKELGANVIVEGKDISVSKQLALKMAKENQGKYINGYDMVDVLAGAGTVAEEIFNQVSDVDAILTPVGGGGLVAATCVAARALSPKTKVFGFVPETCPSMLKSLEAGKPVFTRCKPTLADGLAVPLVGVNSFHTMKGIHVPLLHMFNTTILSILLNTGIHSDIIYKVLPVKESDIAVGILRLLETEKVVAEGAGAISASALLAGSLHELAGKKVVCIISGGNIDTTMVGRCIEKGLAADSRLIKFETMISDRPGGLAELAKITAETGASIKHLAMVSGVFFSFVSFELRTRSHFKIPSEDFFF
ncbi:unnamed protein product [Nippostrongylus brasiliensis]|uniref:L-serine deaminase n=1 Tax=Nippostrongylus brasiliensis TaxID=27835 RepID=A0A0N4Y6U8_NIPBR|nr:unnamed protein product [Nippostrongylus brasiliensis]